MSAQWFAADVGGAALPVPTSGPLAWAIVGASVLIALAPIFVARINQHQKPVDAASPSTEQSSAIRALDSSGELLRQLVHDLQEREERSDLRTHELERELGETKARLASAMAEIASLKAEVGRLTDRLMGGRRYD